MQFMGWVCEYKDVILKAHGETLVSFLGGKEKFGGKLKYNTWSSLYCSNQMMPSSLQL